MKIMHIVTLLLLISINSSVIYAGRAIVVRAKIEKLKPSYTVQIPSKIQGANTQSSNTATIGLLSYTSSFLKKKTTFSYPDDWQVTEDAQSISIESPEFNFLASDCTTTNSSSIKGTIQIALNDLYPLSAQSIIPKSSLALLLPANGINGHTSSYLSFFNEKECASSVVSVKQFMLTGAHTYPIGSLTDDQLDLSADVPKGDLQASFYFLNSIHLGSGFSYMRIPLSSLETMAEYKQAVAIISSLHQNK